MKHKIVFFLFLAALAYIFSNYTAGAASQNGTDGTGASGSSGCSCHGSGNVNTVVELDSAGVPVTSYHPGMAYTVKISGSNGTGSSSLSAFGFQVAVVKASGAGTGSAAQAGTWGTTLPTNVQNTTAASGWGGNFDIIEQSSQITATTGTGGNNNATTYVESIPWTAPAAGTGSVKLYGVINGVNNNNRSSGDYAKAATAVTITEAVAVAAVASVHIALTSGTNPTCASSSVTFTATPTNGGNSPSYQWKVNGANVGLLVPTLAPLTFHW